MNFLKLVPDPSSIPLPFPSPRREDTSDDNNEIATLERLERVKFPNTMRKVNYRQQSESVADVHQKSRRKRKKQQAVSPTHKGDSSLPRQPIIKCSTATVQQKNVIVINPPLNCVLSPPIIVERRNTASRKGKGGPSSQGTAVKSAHRVEHPASSDVVQKAEKTPEKAETGEGKKKRKRKKRSKVSPKEDAASVRVQQHPSPVPGPAAAIELSVSGKNAKGLSRKLKNRSLATKNVSSQKPQPRPFFKPHIAPDLVEHGIGKGVLVRGQLRVNARDPGQCWVVDSSGMEQSDYLILGAKDRNRALHGDTVILRVKSREEWVLRDRAYQEWREDNAEIMDGAGCCAAYVNAEVSVVEESSTVIERQEEIIEEEDAMAMVENEESSLEENLEKRLVYSRDLLVTILSKISPNVYLAASKLQKESLPSTSDAERRVKSVRHSNFRTLRFIAEKDSVPDELLHRTAEVVFIEHRLGARGRAVGLLKPSESGHAIFVPNDAKTPMMKIPPSQLPAGFRKRPQDFASFLFVAEFDDEWPSDCSMATGRLLRQLGCAGDLEAETEGLLMTNNIDYRDFPEELLDSLPACATNSGSEWRIIEAEIADRRDFRDQTVFTIDPSTARDLDDALHIRPAVTALGAEAWEVGVHIADVSHFVHEGTELDEWAASRATSVYLVDRVIPMLPRPLCENLCSLNPGEDKLTFSVVWMMDRKGRILDEWFGRSVIRSCAKLAYDHAEEIIKGADEWLPDREEGLPVQIFNSKAPSDVRESVLRLNYLAKQLRKRRFADGALKLDQPKLKFKLDANTGAPYGLALDERGEANFLVEEFMLLANMAVAKRIYGAFPEIALLRRHPHPTTRTLAEMVEKSSALNYPISGSTSLELNSSLQAYGAQPELQSTVMPFLNKLVMRSMRLAKYFCPGFYKNHRMDEEEDGRDIDKGKEECFRHYALSCDLYTHFTSPIRRYPDVIVHRLLAATLGYSPAPSTNAKEMEKIAERCNEAKSAARVVSDGSAELFFDELIKVVGRLEASGVVIAVFQNAFDVLLTDYGLTRRVYLSKLPSLVDVQFRRGRVFNSLSLTFTAQGKEGKENEVNFKKTFIEVLALVKVVLTPANSKSPLGVRHIATILP